LGATAFYSKTTAVSKNSRSFYPRSFWTERDDRHGIEREIAEKLLERIAVDAHQRRHVHFQRAVFLVVDPVAADRAHTAQRDFALKNQPAGDFVFGALDFVVIEIVLSLVKPFHGDVEGLLRARGVGGEGDVVGAAPVAGIEAEVRLRGERVIDQR